MDIKTFVAETLCQIVEGVAEARAKIAEGGTNAAVNPGHVGAEARREIGHPAPVEFDVAVTVSEESEDKSTSRESGGGGMGVLSIVSAKLAAETATESAGTQRTEAFSRVKFTVMLAQPGDILRREPARQPRTTTAW